MTFYTLGKNNFDPSTVQFGKGWIKIDVSLRATGFPHTEKWIKIKSPQYYA